MTALSGFLFIFFALDENVGDALFDRFLNELVEVIEERSNIVQQVEQDRLRYGVTCNGD